MRWIAALLVVCALGAADAQARQRDPMTFRFAAAVAMNYWAKHDITVPCRPGRRMLSIREENDLTRAFGHRVDMVTYPGSCEVQITPTAEAFRADRDLQLGWLYCTEVVHEIGHIAGLTHGYGGVMALPPVELPWGCVHPRRFRRLASMTRDGWSSRGLRGNAGWRTVGR